MIILDIMVNGRIDQLIVFNKAIVKHKCGYTELSGEFQQRTTQDYEKSVVKKLLKRRIREN